MDNQIVALLRSRGRYDGTETLNFQVSGTSDIGFDPSITGAEASPIGDFTLTATSQTQGAVSYSLSLDKTKKNFLKRVLGSTAQDGDTAVFVEELFLDMLRT